MVGQYEDNQRAQNLIEQGAEYLEDQNVSGLENVVRTLIGLLPPEEEAKFQRGYGSTVTK